LSRCDDLSYSNYRIFCTKIIGKRRYSLASGSWSIPLPKLPEQGKNGQDGYNRQPAASFPQPPHQHHLGEPHDGKRNAELPEQPGEVLVTKGASHTPSRR
jgi:hypothetical protein